MKNRSSDKVLSQRAIREQNRDERKRLAASLKSEEQSKLKRAKRIQERYELKNKLNDELTETTWADLETLKKDSTEDETNLKKIKDDDEKKLACLSRIKHKNASYFAWTEHKFVHDPKLCSIHIQSHIANNNARLNYFQFHSFPFHI